jgi:ketosteroid isomerase-like protein
MDAQHCKQAVIDAWKHFASRDHERIAAAFTPDAEWVAPRRNATAVALGYTDHMVGRQQIAGFIAREFHKLFVRDVAVDLRRVYCDGHTVIVEERMTATLAHGRHYENDYCFFFELADDGRIERVREYMDTRLGQACIFGDQQPAALPLG